MNQTTNDTTIKIANAPCSWGVLEFELEGDKKGYEEVLNEMKAAGYAGTELGDWGFMPTDPAALRSALQTRNLELLGAFVPVALVKDEALEEGIERALRTAGLLHAAGYPGAFIVLADENGSVPERTRKAGRVGAADLLDQVAYKRIATNATRLALAVKEKFGMRTVFHHHGAGYVETPQEIDWLLEGSDPGLLGLCFDTGHYMLGGGTDPVGFMKKHFERIWHVHFKDFDPAVRDQATRENWDYFQSVQNGVFCELGKGAVPFDAVKTLLQEEGYKDWIVVEQDVLPGMGNPFQCAQKNRQFLASIQL
ncbi:TIM barrel protein [Flavihumibacter sp. CACIAM 22H1]|uniref:TIM barrel protein n=1 Tax=Flavihumibacter sp. CACIAM 22H1 TaxID=1812911 RepID=UPI0007A90F86|nr:TIM barrel protein [Flavihumibacter sp. CACIAM 22H1]KYP15472.1 MAG: xylose isomerase [Flavihumibacter sp. CACIAM 22H1]